jgi:ubiquinone/menaquinone biosynthesis C-methylase UbiE
VTGVDVNAGMLTVAARESSGLPAAVEWRQAPADRLPFGDGEFDAVVCQQGLQFFPMSPPPRRRRPASAARGPAWR